MPASAILADEIQAIVKHVKSQRPLVDRLGENSDNLEVKQVMVGSKWGEG
jgi:hypothetical protein